MQLRVFLIGMEIGFIISNKGYMKKNILILLLSLVCFSSCSKWKGYWIEEELPQLDRLGYFDKSHVDCAIYLSKDSFYITIPGGMDDIFFEEPIAYGEYSRTGKELYLHDSMNGVETILEKNGLRSLTVLISFPFLTGKHFKRFKLEKDYLENFIPIYGEDAKTRIAKYNEEHPEPFELQMGKYFATGSSQEYLLELHKAGEYRLRYYNLLLSKGFWKREGNVLHLYSSSQMSLRFDLQIADSMLIAPVGSLPGDIDRCKEHEFRIDDRE